MGPWQFPHCVLTQRRQAVPCGCALNPTSPVHLGLPAALAGSSSRQASIPAMPDDRPTTARGMGEANRAGRQQRQQQLHDHGR